VFPLKDNIPTDRFPVVTVVLIVANVLMYLFFQKALGGGVWSPDTNEFNARVIEYGAIPYEVTHPGDQCVPASATRLECGGAEGLAPTWLTVFSSMFMHGSLLHIAGNMLFLWIFGNNVEDSMGPVKFLLFYLLGGIAAIGAQTLIDPDAAVPTVGASGAVAAVLGGYLLLFPKARVVTVIFIVFFFTIIEIPALIVLGLWFVQQIVFGSLDYLQPATGGGGVAYFAHIGGFVFGLLLIKLFATRERSEKPLF
jgi:membrane associated rhomboid family serine protease